MPNAGTPSAGRSTSTFLNRKREAATRSQSLSGLASTTSASACVWTVPNAAHSGLSDAPSAIPHPPAPACPAEKLEDEWGKNSDGHAGKFAKNAVVSGGEVQHDRVNGRMGSDTLSYPAGESVWLEGAAQRRLRRPLSIPG